MSFRGVKAHLFLALNNRSLSGCIHFPTERHMGCLQCLLCFNCLITKAFSYRTLHACVLLSWYVWYVHRGSLLTAKAFSDET